MKKNFIIFILGSATLITSMGSFAAPPDQDSYRQHWKERNAPFSDDEKEQRMRERQMRAERGVERLKQHRWQTGYVMPQHYRGNGYKVDYRENNLPKPDRNQQWYKINNDYILVDSDDNSIIQIKNF